jgi:hypothetical protein
MANAPVIVATLRKDDNTESLEAESQQHIPIKDLSSGVAGITITAPDKPAQQNLSTSYKHAPDSFDSHGITSLGTSMNSASTTSGVVAEQMTMFRVVFALSAKSTLRTADLYEHVTKKLSKALKFCQKRSNYVSTESRKLLAVKQRARAEKTPTASLWTQLVSHSELAWASQEVYTRISADNISGIRLDGMGMSLQIPPQPRPDDLAVTPLSAILLLESRHQLQESPHPPSWVLHLLLRLQRLRILVLHLQHQPHLLLRRRLDSLLDLLPQRPEALRFQSHKHHLHQAREPTAHHLLYYHHLPLLKRLHHRVPHFLLCHLRFSSSIAISSFSA